MLGGEKMTKNSKPERAKREIDLDLVAKIVMVLSIIGIVVTTIMIFTPPISSEDYAELALLTYDPATEEYRADNYPTSVDYNQTAGLSEGISLSFMLSNYYNIAKFYEVRLKIGLYNVVISEDTPGSNTSTYFYQEHWKQKVLAYEQIWGPSQQTNVTFNFNSDIITKLGLESNGYKLIFELWEWNSNLDDFDYTGIFVYLTSFKLNLV